MKNKLFAVIHIWPQNQWKNNIEDKFIRMNNSNLFNTNIELYLNITQPKQEDLDYINKLTNQYYPQTNLIIQEQNLVEYHAIKKVKEIADNNEGLTLFLHTKGSSKPFNDIDHGWDQMMANFTINHWKWLTNKLEDGFNCSGCNFRSAPHKHFSGNFWWARNDYLKTLQEIIPPINSDQQFFQYNSAFFHIPYNRWYYEMWIGLSNNMKPFSAFEPPIDIAQQPIQESMYKNVKPPKIF
jgi:hypothetical protein